MGTPLHPAVRELEQLIADDAVVRMYFERMIDEVPRGRQYRNRHLQSVPQLLRLVDEVMTMAPEFSEDSTVMLPLGAILDWTMATPAGFAAYRDPRVNAALQRILNAWCDFLTSSASRYVLNDSASGWKSPAARRAIGIEQYQHDAQDEHWGFASWNDFFTRRFLAGARPVASPKDDKVIVSACESTPFALATNVQRCDSFWLKSQPYSLRDMLAGDRSTDSFVGGTVYQAFLSATNYHRWHSPVAGTIVRAVVVPGTYYSEPDSEGSQASDPKVAQAYLAHVAARAVFIIDADDPVIGLVAFVPVGMSEVSSCVIDPTVAAGRHVDKGDDLGYFQFGGSTHCLVFQPGAIDSFALPATPRTHGAPAPLVLVRSELARAATHR